MIEKKKKNNNNHPLLTTTNVLGAVKCAEYAFETHAHSFPIQQHPYIAKGSKSRHLLLWEQISFFNCFGIMQ